jgi:TMEM175 potassium channel family protein
VSNDEPEYEARAAERLIFFSDAVVAIAITLLAIDLPVPSGPNAHALLASARQNDGHYAAFLISFLAIAAAWSQHHDVFRYVKRMDSRLRTFNMAWLMMIVLIPFATKLLTANGHDSVGAHALRFGFYALVQVLESATLLAMVHHMISGRLQEAETPPRIVTDANWQSAGVMLGFGLSIPVFFATNSGWLLWIVIPLLVGQLHRRQIRRDLSSSCGTGTRRPVVAA